jgi:Protein of unknown function (DUF5132)
MNPAQNGHDAADKMDGADQHDESHEGGINKTVATVVVVAAGAALFEAALLPGLVIGVAAMAAPKYLPKLASSLNPLFKSTVRGTYKFAQKSKEMFAEAREQVHDVVAEVKAENETAANNGAASRPAA